MVQGAHSFASGMGRVIDREAKNCYTDGMDKQSLTPLFAKAVELGASDVHVAVGTPIMFRVDGELKSQTAQDVTAEQAEQIVHAMVGDTGFKRLQQEKEIDVSYGLKDGVRLRVNCLYERGNLSLAARIIPAEIPAIAALDLTDIATRIAGLQDGLVLFTGPTGAGKSTSLAAIIAQLNQDRAPALMTLEDPIEFLFPKAKGIIRQRQYGEDFLSFPEALKHVLRQDPDIVMVGEMRDPETIAAALTLAETGHLIFATLHTPNAAQAVDRIVDVFPPHQQSQVRSQLSLSLKMVVAQQLLLKVGGGRVALREVLINTPAVANIIRDNRTPELASVLQTGENVGMITFEKAAKRLFKEGIIDKASLAAAVGER